MVTELGFIFWAKQKYRTQFCTHDKEALSVGFLPQGSSLKDHGYKKHGNDM